MAILFTLDYFDICSEEQKLGLSIKNWHLFETNLDYTEALQFFGMIKGCEKQDFDIGIRKMAKAVQEKFFPAILFSKRIEQDYLEFIKDVEKNTEISFKNIDVNEEDITIGTCGFFSRYIDEVFADKLNTHKFKQMHINILKNSVSSRMGAIRQALQNQFDILKTADNLMESYKGIAKQFVGAQWGLVKEETVVDFNEKIDISGYSIFQNCIVKLPIENFEIERAWNMIFELDKE